MIEVKNLTKSFLEAGNKRVVLDNISFIIPDQKIFAIVGLSGCGKSTLVKLLLGLLKPDSGDIMIDETTSDQFNKLNKIQPVFQNNYKLLNPLRSIGNTLFEVAKKFNHDNKFVYEYLTKLDLPKSILDKKGYQLSGGEQQRIAFLRVLIADPDTFILDEIFSAQDEKSKQTISQLIVELNKEKGKTIIIVSHNLSLIKEIADDAIILFKGNIVERGDLKKLFNNPTHDYTKLLIKSENYELTQEDLKTVDLI